MALRADNSDLPRATEGNPPDPMPRFGMLLAQAWAAQDAERAHGTKSRTDVPMYVRLGWAGKCARDIGYRLLEVEKSNPPDIAAIWRMGLGTMVHDKLQEIMPAAYPGAEIEKVVGSEHDEIMGLPTSGRSDVYLVTTDDDVTGSEPGKRILIEVKTINGFGFKSTIGARGSAEGARSGAIFQAAVNARAHGADEVVIVEISLECLSDRELESLVKKQGGTKDPIRKFVAEWSYTMAELDELVDRELKRLEKIVAMSAAVQAEYDDYKKAFEPVDSSDEPTPLDEWLSTHTAGLPPRSIPLEMPAKGRVVDPGNKGRWQVVVDGNVMDAGETWWCGYCDFKDRCIADGPS